MRLFYSPDLSADLCELTAEESKHCAKVLRMSPGDTLHLTDGKGLLCRAHLVSTHPTCVAAIDERIYDYGARPYHFHLAIAPPKNPSRLEWFVEKAVEIGIDEISPIVCDHSERATLNLPRLERIAQSAMLQSLKSSFPIIHQPVTLAEFAQTPFPGTKLVCYCAGDERTPIQTVCPPHTDVVLLIGPEGDFSETEISTLLNNQFQPVTLGESRLRTETAALVATAFVSFVNQ